MRKIFSYGKEAVFHRAFDCVDNAHIAIQQLIACKVDRVLTSGLQASAIQGADCIRDLVSDFSDSIEILAGAGIQPSNVKEFVLKTKVQQVHTSAKTWYVDSTTSNHNVSYAYHNANDYDGVNIETVKQLKGVLCID